MESITTSALPPLDKFQRSYETAHGYIATVICFFGVCSNLAVIIVLTRKHMKSATNCILTALALSDALAMLAYIPFAIRQYIVFPPPPNPEKDTYEAAQFLLFYAHFSVTVHTISIWLTVILAVFRYIYIRFPQHGSYICSLPRAKVAVVLVYVFCVVINIPNYVFLGIMPDNTMFPNATLYYVSNRNGTEADYQINQFNFYVQALLVRLLPCVGLTVMSILLVRTLHKVDERRRNMGTTLTLLNPSSTTQETARDRRTHRTTMMLVAVVVMFVVTELPQGILSLMSGLVKDFFENVYSPLGDLMDVLTLINNSVNFILYCTMSKQFRDTFVELFWKPVTGNQRNRSGYSSSPTNHSCAHITNGKSKVNVTLNTSTQV